ncbi:hypothetical protein ACFLWX_02690 [Chloroflexota bacterium]
MPKTTNKKQALEYFKLAEVWAEGQALEIKPTLAAIFKDAIESNNNEDVGNKRRTSKIYS